MEENLLMLTLKRIPSGNVCMLAAVPQHQRHHWFFVNASMMDSFCSLFSALHAESAGSVPQTLQYTPEASEMTSMRLPLKVFQLLHGWGFCGSGAQGSWEGKVQSNLRGCQVWGLGVAGAWSWVTLQHFTQKWCFHGRCLEKAQ